MPMRRLLVLITVLLTAASPTLADSWMMPTVKTTYSANKSFRFVATPRNVGSQLAYFTAKAEGKSATVAAPPRGRLERLEGATWVPVWERDLVNEVAPVEVVVSDDGSGVVTFDNWHSTGYGDNVVVVYGAGGALVRSLGLADMMPSYFIDALPHSVSSINWRSGDPVIVGESLEFVASGPSGEQREKAGFTIKVSLVNGAVEPMSAEQLALLAPHFCASHISKVHEQNEWLAFERRDLVFPANGKRDDWKRYQYQVVNRLGSSGQLSGFGLSDEPFELLLPGEYMDADFRKNFREALTLVDPELPVRWFASRDLELMAREVERTARKIKPGQLDGVEMRFISSAGHWPRIESALRVSGARLVLIDINRPVPQNAERLKELPPDETVDPYCLQFAK